MLESQTISPEDGQDISIIVNQMKAKIKADRARRMGSLEKTVSKRRDEAIRARKASGIETIWSEDTDHYEGIDEFNRAGSTYYKPSPADGPLRSYLANNTSTNQCTSFFNITRQFVDSASARAGDILLPAGDWNWGIKKTPIADAVDGVVDDQSKQDSNAQKVKKGEQRIKDWLIETRYHREYRRVIDSSAKIGTGILKGPYPVKRTSRAVVDGNIVTQIKIAPASKSVDPRNFFPDMNCGNDIQKGDYVFERDYITYKQLSDLADMPEYFEDSVKKVLEEGPKKQYLSERKSAQESDLFEIWYFTGNIDLNDMDLLDDRFREELDVQQNEDGSIEICGCEKPKGKDFKSVVVVLVNDTIISGHLNPLEDGAYPYDLICWQRQEHSPFGIGIARQGRVAQQMFLSTARNLIDNMALSAMPMIGMRQKGVTPENGEWDLEKGKVWWLTDENIRTMSEAIEFLQVPSLQKELMEILMLAGKMFEDATGVNSLLQGQQGSAPDTVGGMELLHKNASALLRRIARISDEDGTEPHIGHYYDWLLMYGEDDEKGDMQIEARGSSVLVEREIEAMQAQTLLQYASDPAYGLSKKKIMGKIIVNWGFDTSDVMMDKLELEQLEQTQAQPTQDPRLQIEQMRTEKDLKIAEQNAQLKAMQIKKDQDRDAMFAQGVTERNRISYESQISELQLRRELAMLDYANKHQMQLDDIKAKLADSSMKWNVTRELAAMDATADKLPKPPIEPPQRALPGESFQQ